MPLCRITPSQESSARRAAFAPVAWCCMLLAAIVVLVTFEPLMAQDRPYPRPAPVPPRWELTFKPGELRLYVDDLEDRAYWYFDYEIVNRTGEDLIWAPQFTLYTDAGELLPSGRNVPRRVTHEIINLLGDELLETQYEIIGDILQGVENAKSGVVVWPAESLDVTELTVFIAGISGETVRVINPLTGEPVLLRKTLQRDYQVPGNPLARGSRPLTLTDERWIMR